MEMTMARTIRHMAIGLQSSGKTTFAAALWYLVDSREVPILLSKGAHTGDFAYLEKIAAEWSEAWQVPRTGIGQHENIRMNLKDRATGQDVVLRFVDLPGESYERAFATRLVSDHVVEAFQESTGLMLFVRADQPRDDVTLLDLAKTLQEDADEDKLLDETMAEATFDPAKTPRQVQIVDFLQSIQDDPLNLDIERVAVIISAWDKSLPDADPDTWLKEKMPLLDQYLCNLDAEVRVYGVSAQGGDVPDKKKGGGEASRKALLSLAKATERIKVIGNGAALHDLTHPVRWLSGLEDA